MMKLERGYKIFTTTRKKEGSCPDLGREGLRGIKLSGLPGLKKAIHYGTSSLPSLSVNIFVDSTPMG
jgi:hypothetical protein